MVKKSMLIILTHLIFFSFFFFLLLKGSSASNGAASRVLVTGATGFVAGHIIEQLLAKYEASIVSSILKSHPKELHCSWNGPQCEGSIKT